MPLILTPITNLNDNIEMPYEMRPYVSPAAWAEIIRAKNEVLLEANGSACMIEFCLCIFIFPILPFLFHPCISYGLYYPIFKSRITAINNAYYQGRSVIGTTLSTLTVNTDIIPSECLVNNNVIIIQTTTSNQNQPVYASNQYQQNSSYEPVYASAEVIQAPIAPSQGFNNHSTPVAEVISSQNGYGKSAPSSPSGSRQMAITIPPGTSPGSTITVLSPEGLQVQIVAPPNISPGQQIIVKY